MTGVLELLRAVGDSPFVVDATHDDPVRAVWSGNDLLRLARVLRAQAGPVAGDEGVAPLVSVLCHERIHQLVFALAGLAAGLVVHPIDPAAPPPVRAAFLGHARPFACIVDSSDDAGIADVPRLQASTMLGSTHEASDAPAPGGLLVYTSGSTGHPKGVLLPARALLANAMTAAEVFGHRRGHVSGSILPFTHTFALVSDVLMALARGGRVVALPAFSLEQAGKTLARMAQHEVESYSAVPVVLDALARLRLSIPALRVRHAIAGAAPLAEATRTAYEKRLGHPVLPCYGLSECACFATISTGDAVRPGAVGKPRDLELRVLLPSGDAAPAGTIGEIALRGPNVIRSYFRDGGRLSEAFRHDGWFCTGDLGKVDADGTVFVTGRAKNMVIRGGVKVYLEDIDRALQSRAGVVSACSVPRNAGSIRESISTFVVLEAGAAQDAGGIRDAIRSALGDHAVPDDVFFVDDIPRTRTGKPLYATLAARATELGG